MKLTFTLIYCFLAFFLNAQVISNQPVTGPPFDYGRDFRMILERTKDKNDTLFYNKLLRRFHDNDSSLTRGETLALMIGFTENPNYQPVKDMETEKEIIELNDNGFYDDALLESKTYLAKHPLSLSILKERSFAYHQLGKRDSAKYFMALTDKIMEAMIYSGKGNKPETPFFSLGLNDGDYFIPNVGLSLTNKATENDRNKRFLYVTTAMTDEGTYKKYYFMIHHAKLKMDGDDLEERNNHKKLKKAQAKKSSKKGKKGKMSDGSEGGSEAGSGEAATPNEVPANGQEETPLPDPPLIPETGAETPAADSLQLQLPPLEKTEPIDTLKSE